MIYETYDHEHHFRTVDTTSIQLKNFVDFQQVLHVTTQAAIHTKRKFEMVLRIGY
jgi:hypothetical protein